MPPRPIPTFGGTNPQPDRFDYNYEYDYAMLDNNANDLPQVETCRAPEDQVKGLTEDQLEEVFTRVLTAADPNISKTTVKYHFKEGLYKVDQSISHLAIHFNMDGNLTHVDSAEAKEMDSASGAAKPREPIPTNPLAAMVEKVNTSAQAGDVRLEGKRNAGTSAGIVGTSSATGTASVGPNGRLLKNQFNFTERALQCTGNPMRERSIATEPPATVDHTGFVSQWSIFDAYLKDLSDQLASRGQQNKGKEESKEVVPEKPVEGEEDQEDEAVVAANAALEAAANPAPTEDNALTTSTSATAAKEKERDLDRIFSSSKMARALKVVERALVANWDVETYRTYKYVDDLSPCPPAPGGIAAGILAATAAAANADARAATTPSDLGVLPPEARGRVTPLWRLHNEELSLKHSVTAVCWHPSYGDLLAVGYGSHDFTTSHKLTQGFVHCYSLKNPTYPEAKFTLPSPVTSIAWHPTLPSVLAVGMYSGAVAILDAARSGSDPLYIAHEPGVKHVGPVWQVQWPYPPIENPVPTPNANTPAPAPVSGSAATTGAGVAANGAGAEAAVEKLSFYSVSADGYVCEWTAQQHLLWRTDVAQLSVAAHKNALLVHGKGHAGDTAGTGAGAGASGGETVTGDGQSTLVTRYAGTCLSLHPTLPLLSVGTEEGHVYSMQLGLGAAIVHTHAGHHLPVYRVIWNELHPNVLASCAADWTVKVWDKDAFAPVLTLDLAAPVADVRWAPSRAAVLWCASADGWVRAFDLTQSQRDPVAEVRVTRASRLTQMCVCARASLVCVGDEKGIVTVAKVSARVGGAGGVDDVDAVKEQRELANVLVTRDARGHAKTITLVPPRHSKSKKKLEQEARAAAEAAAAKSKDSNKEEEE